MPVFGFKANSRHDQLAVTNLLSSSAQISLKTYDTLAQYNVKDVQLKPTNNNPNLPRKWALTINTNLAGFNLPSGQALWFNDNSRPVGDGYLTYDLTSQEFGQILNGGAYDNPQGYLKQLKELLQKQPFYRKTKVQLMQLDLPSNHLDISVGDFRARPETGARYFIGQDLRSYEGMTPNRQLESNLKKQLGANFAVLEDNPVKPAVEPEVQNQNVDENALKKNAKSIQMKMPKLPEVNVEHEVNNAPSFQAPSMTSDLTPKSSESTTTPSSASKVKPSLATLNLNSSSTVTPVHPNSMTFDDLMKQLNRQKAMSNHLAAGPRHKDHAYTDDFAQALAQSKASHAHSNVRRITREKQAQSAAPDRGPEM